MSHTVSRGYHDESRYIGVATAVSEQLLALGQGKPWTNEYPAAMMGMETFFKWVLVGIAFGNRKTTDSSIPTIGGICALSIAMRLLNAKRPGKKEWTTAEVKVWAEKNLKLITKLQKLHRRLKMDGSIPGIRKLRLFLNDLVEKGREIESAKVCC